VQTHWCYLLCGIGVCPASKIGAYQVPQPSNVENPWPLTSPDPYGSSWSMLCVLTFHLHFLSCSHPETWPVPFCLSSQGAYAQPVHLWSHNDLFSCVWSLRRIGFLGHEARNRKMSDLDHPRFFHLRCQGLVLFGRACVDVKFLPLCCDQNDRDMHIAVENQRAAIMTKRAGRNLIAFTILCCWKPKDAEDDSSAAFVWPCLTCHVWF
jgi:hypothetical protein